MSPGRSPATSGSLSLLSCKMVIAKPAPPTSGRREGSVESGFCRCLETATKSSVIFSQEGRPGVAHSGPQTLPLQPAGSHNTDLVASSKKLVQKEERCHMLYPPECSPEEPTRALASGSILPRIATRPLSPVCGKTNRLSAT